MSANQKLELSIGILIGILILMGILLWVKSYSRDQKRAYNKINKQLISAITESQLHLIKWDIETFKKYYSDDKAGNTMYKDLCQTHSEILLEWDELKSLRNTKMKVV